MSHPTAILVRRAAQHNLRHIDIDIPLHQVVAVTGPSGSGKSSLALGVLYAEGLRRFLRGLAPQLQQRAGQAPLAQVERIDFLPHAVALRQHPPRPGSRSTVGTLTGLLTPLRVLFSRVGVHPCPRGHQMPPFSGEAADCPDCGTRTLKPTAESFAFNGSGACPECAGSGERRDVDLASLVPDESLSLADGAVASWRASGRSHMPNVAAELGVRIDVPYSQLSTAEREIVLSGEPVDREVLLVTKKGRPITFTATYDNAVAAVRKGMAADSTATIRKRMDRFLRVQTCSGCHGARLRPEALGSTVAGRTLAEVGRWPLSELDSWLRPVPEDLPAPLRRPAEVIVGEMTEQLAPLLGLGAGYLALDRAGATLSSGELQRIQLAATVLGRATGILYILDEPSIGLHPANVAALGELMHALTSMGNSVVVVDHDLDLVRRADHVIDLGPGSGRQGGTVVATGTPARLMADEKSVTGAFMAGRRSVRRPAPGGRERGSITVTVSGLHNLRDVAARFPVQRLTVVTGVSGAGKSALLRGSLVPAVEAALRGQALPPHVSSLDAPGVRRVLTIDSTPVGRNARSTPATYCGVFDLVRELLASTPEARRRGWDAGRFSYNTAPGQCPACKGIGEEETDLQYLPDVSAACGQCDGTRYAKDVLDIRLRGRSVADILALTVDQAAEFFAAEPVAATLRRLAEVGLGYLVLGQPTPTLAGGEAQRLKLATELAKGSPGTLYVLDEPSTGLHPTDVQTLLAVFDGLLAQGSTVVVVEHDRDVIGNADHVVDMGPGGGPHGGRLVVQGAPADVMTCPESVTGQWLQVGRGPDCVLPAACAVSR